MLNEYFPILKLAKQLYFGKCFSNQDQTLDDVSMSVIEDAAQLVKYNSIQGNKMNDIDVVYTMWSNLHKTEGMEVGQVNYT